MEKIDKNCKIHGICQHYITKQKRILCAKCNVERVQKRRDNLKLMAVNHLGGKCIYQDCGYNKCISALEFHHKDSNQKDFGISASGHTRGWDKLKKELDKCVLLCAICHREVHAGIRLPIW